MARNQHLAKTAHHCASCLSVGYFHMAEAKPNGPLLPAQRTIRECSCWSFRQARPRGSASAKRMLLAFIRRAGHCNAWHPIAGGWGKECLRVICQALRSRETSSLEMAKKLALLVPGVPRSHGAELSKCCTMKSPAASFKWLSANNSAPRAHHCPPARWTKTTCCHCVG